jgi:hypothetical protein
MSAQQLKSEAAILKSFGLEKEIKPIGDEGYRSVLDTQRLVTCVENEILRRRKVEKQEEIQVCARAVRRFAWPMAH